VIVMKKSLSRVVGAGGHSLLGVSTVAFLAYFLASSAVGAGVVSVVAESDLNGGMNVGSILADPVSGTLAMADLTVTDSSNAPVATVGGIAVTPSAITETDLSNLLVQRARINVRIDEDGRVNLDGLFKEKEKKEPGKPSLLRVAAFGVADSTVTIETPWADLFLGPIDADGNHTKQVDGSVSGSTVVRIAGLTLTPKSASLAAYLAALTGTGGSLTVGPLDLDAAWTRQSVTVHRLSLEAPGGGLFLKGEADVASLAGQAAATFRYLGREVASASVKAHDTDWHVSTMVAHLAVPEGTVEGLWIPAAQVDGLLLSVSEENVSVSLDRMTLGAVRQGDLVAGPLSLSGSIRYSPRTTLSDIAAEIDALPSPGLAPLTVLQAWVSGETTLTFLADELSVRGSPLARPLRLRVYARPDKQGTRAELLLSLHPLGALQAEWTMAPRPRDGGFPCSAHIWTDGFDLDPLLAAVDLPPMVRKMVSGRLKGQVRFTAKDLASAHIRVQACRFETSAKDGSGLVVECRPGEQEFDFSVEPDFSYLKREISFGPGKMTFQMKAGAQGNGTR
jgi:hypothetical protein